MARRTPKHGLWRFLCPPADRAYLTTFEIAWTFWWTPLLAAFTGYFVALLVFDARTWSHWITAGIFGCTWAWLQARATARKTIARKKHESITTRGTT